jgi:hypothetical protein
MLVTSSMIIFAGSCNPSNSEPPLDTSNTVKPVEIKTIPNTLGFGPIIGESLPLSTPTPGLYRGSSEFSQQKFITRERDISNSIQSRTVIDLLDGGNLTACFAGMKDEHTSVSKYESRDGENHKYDNNKRWIFGAKGTWSIVDGKAKLLLHEVRQGTCTPDVPQSGFELPFELSCVLVGPNDKLPNQIMACRLDKEPGWLNQAGLDLGKSSKVGPWSFRFTTRGSTGKKEPNGPWLLLSAGEGLHVKSTDKRRDPIPVLTFAKGAKELVEDDWKYNRPAQ